MREKYYRPTMDISECETETDVLTASSFPDDTNLHDDDEYNYPING